MICDIVTTQKGVPPILREKLKPVEQFDNALVQLIENMQETMLAPDPKTGVKGVGLAANRIGVDARVILVTLNIGTKKDPKVLAMINPEITDSSEQKVWMEEGCLSVPGQYDKVSRSAKIRVRWQNVNGEWAEKKFDNWDARIIQHEADHLDGILFTDYLRRD